MSKSMKKLTGLNLNLINGTQQQKKKKREKSIEQNRIDYISIFKNEKKKKSLPNLNLIKSITTIGNLHIFNN